MDFEIKSEKEYRIVFSDRSYDKKGWLTHYTVGLFSPHINGIVRVDNSPYGQSPLTLFKSMEREWKGWEGEKSWGSLEGEFDLTAVSDRKGHITLKTRIHSGHYLPSSSLMTELIVESGQLDYIASKAEEFFKC